MKLPFKFKPGDDLEDISSFRLNNAFSVIKAVVNLLNQKQRVKYTGGNLLVVPTRASQSARIEVMVETQFIVKVKKVGGSSFPCTYIYNLWRLENNPNTDPPLNRDENGQTIPLAPLMPRLPVIYEDIPGNVVYFGLAFYDKSDNNKLKLYSVTCEKPAITNCNC